MTIQKAMDMFENKWFVLVNPSAWLDPFENFISKVKFYENGKEKHIEYLENIYGICLTLGSETNLMWDAYTPNKNGIRLTFSIKKLINELKSDSDFDANSFIAKQVSYVRYKDFMSRLDNDIELVRLFKNQDMRIIENLFEKRYEYRYEEEFRILYNANNSDHKSKEILKIQIDPTNIVEGIRFDPKMPDSECEALKKYFNRQGIDGRSIKRSLLYKYEIKKSITL